VSKQQRIVSIGVLVVLLLAVGWTLLPFRFADAVDCGPPLLGAKPGHYDEKGVGLINPKRDCHNTAKSRLTFAAVASLIAVVTGAATIALQPVSRFCAAGNHEECPEWWPAALGPFGESLSCQCSCHIGHMT
jgi:hypothetical protein